MTSSAHYQHLSSSLNSVHEKVEQLTRELNSLKSKLSALDGSVVSPAPVMPVSTNVQTKLLGMKSHCIFGPVSTVLDLSSDIGNIEGNLVFVTLVGGGGAGSSGMAGGQVIRRSGSGGGAGETIHRRIISLYGCTGKLIITAGAGGDSSSPNGGYTSVEPEMIDHSRSPIVAHGGLGGSISESFSTGGEGAKSETYKMASVFDGQDGQDGQEQDLPGPVSIQGGSGGSSYFAQGGFGGYAHYVKDALEKTVPSPKGQDGSFGSGGGGSIPGISSSMIGKGGHGFVIVEYSLKDC